MYGYDHILLNLSLCAVGAALAQRLHMPAASPVPPAHDVASWTGALALAAGSLAPDMDDDRSTIRRATLTDGLAWRGPHRGWTHTAWACLAAAALAAAVPWAPVRWFAVGWVLHVCADAASTAGIAWCYPLPRPAWHLWNGIVCRDRTPGPRYRTGGRSEHIIVGAAAALALACLALTPGA